MELGKRTNIANANMAANTIVACEKRTCMFIFSGILKNDKIFVKIVDNYNKR